ncbi:hypothetical protein AMTRI_Chr08g210100 [Amborella trichopoda]
MGWQLKPLALLWVVLIVPWGSTMANPDFEKFSGRSLLEANSRKRIGTAPSRNLESLVIDGSGREAAFIESKDDNHIFEEGKARNSRVSVSTVAWFTLAMAAATGLGAVPFFFVELEPQWAGVCNGLAAGVMLAASFDLVQEGQVYGGGNWVVFGILSGGVFIWVCKKFLEEYGEVSMLDIKGADARKVVLVIGIMTLHSFGEGSGVGVSFAGSKGLSQGVLVTLAIAVHNIPEGLAVSMVLASRGVSPQNAMLWSVITSLPQPLVAVPSFICADAFHKFLPFCTGFAAGCMIWMVIAEVLPDAFKEASPSQVASAATLAVAFMETLSTVLQSFGHGYSSEHASGFLVSLLFGLGPFLGGATLVALATALRLQHSLLSAFSSGIAFILASWRPLQLLFSSKLSLLPTLSLLALGSTLSHTSTTSLRLVQRKASLNALNAPTLSLPLSAPTLQAFLASCTIALHALAEGLALGVAAPKAYGLGRHMLLPASLHGLPRGMAVASCVFGATDGWRIALLASALAGLAGPISAIGAIVSGIGYEGLDLFMVFACGWLVPSFWGVLSRAWRVDSRRTVFGLGLGAVFAILCLASTRLVCLHTPYCDSAPEAVT